MDNRPIGVFDSGVGGMTVLKELAKQLPNENFIYLGDTKRFPYGSKSKESIIELTKDGVEFLINKGVKLIVIACGTATSQALEEVQPLYNIPIIGVIEPTVKYIKEINKKQIGVIATAGTIRSKGWEKAILKELQTAKVQSIACPLLAPMVEEGWYDNKIAELAIKEYLKPFNKIDAIILGCTHYPIYQTIIKEEMPYEVELIDTGYTVAKYLGEYLKDNNMENHEIKNKEIVYLTKSEDNFKDIAKNILNCNINIKII